MRTGALISVAMHISVMLIAYFGLPWTVDEMELEAPIIEVDLVEVTDETNLPPKEMEQELEEKPETPAPPKLQAAPPPPPPPPPEPEPVSEPEPEPAPKPLKMAALPEPEPVPEPPKPEEKKPEVKKEEPKPAPKPVPRPIAKPKVPPKKPEKEKDTFDPARIAALLDKKKDDGPRQQAPKKVPIFKQPEIKASTTAPKSAFVARLTISEEDHLRRQIERCWTVPAGARDAENLVVKIRIALNPDGSLRGQPRIVDQERLRQPGQEFYRTAAESARRAVLQCAPYSMPRDKYERWRDIVLTFNPKQMLDG